jgi:hypothetical protein
MDFIFGLVAFMCFIVGVAASVFEKDPILKKNVLVVTSIGFFVGVIAFISILKLEPNVYRETVVTNKVNILIDNHYREVSLERPVKIEVIRVEYRWSISSNDYLLKEINEIEKNP